MDADFQQYFTEMLEVVENDPAAPTGLVAMLEALGNGDQSLDDALVETRAMTPSERAASRAYLLAHRETDDAIGHRMAGQAHELLNAILSEA